MSAAPEFTHNQARLATQHALLLPEHEWASIKNVKDFVVFLDMVRNSNLGRWLGQSAYRHQHDIEIRLRKQFSTYIAHISAWQPEPWQKAMQWCQILLYLPWLKLLWQNKPHNLTWTERDELISYVSNSEESTASYNGLIHLRQAIENHEPALNTWLSVWYDLWPSHDSNHATELKNLEIHWKAMLDSLHEDSLDGIAQIDDDRILTLHDWFHEYPNQPVSAYIILSLSAIEMFRLRRELLKRSNHAPQIKSLDH